MVAFLKDLPRELSSSCFQVFALPTSGGHQDAGSVIWPRQVPSRPFDEQVVVLKFLTEVFDENEKSLFAPCLYPKSWVANSWTQIVEGDDLYVLAFGCALPWCSLCRFCLSAWNKTRNTGLSFGTYIEDGDISEKYKNSIAIIEKNYTYCKKRILLLLPLWWLDEHSNPFDVI